MLKYKGKYNNAGKNEAGISGFLQQPPQPYPSYYVINYTDDSNGNDDPNGFLILGKTLSPAFIGALGEKLGYTIHLIAPTSLATTPEKKKEIVEMVARGVSYVDLMNNQLLAVYSQITDFDSSPISLARADLSRDMHLSVQKAALHNQTLLFIISMV